MAITFNSLQDSFGLQSAGSVLAQALLNNSQQARQQQNLLQRDVLQNQFQTQRDKNIEQTAIAKEMRQRQLSQKFGPLLGQTLSIAYDAAATPEQKSQALQGYLSAGGSLSDVQAAYKDLSQQNQTIGLLNQLGINRNQPANQMNPQMIRQNQSAQMQANQQMRPQDVIDVNERVTVDNGNFFDTIDENTAIALSSSPNQQLANIGKAAIEAKKLQQSRFEADRKFESQRSLPFLKQIDDQRAAIDNKKRAANQLDAALADGETGGFSINNIARIFGRPELLDQKGAQLVGAVKELLVSNIGRVGARPNQWIEQQISLALPDLGKSRIANQTLAEAVKGEVALADQRVKLTDEIAAQDQAQFGYVKGDIASRVDRAIKPYADQIDRRAAYRMRELYEQEQGAARLRKTLLKKVPEGTPITPQMARLFMERYNNNAAQAIENAKKLGYTVYTSEQVREVN